MAIPLFKDLDLGVGLESLGSRRNNPVERLLAGPQRRLYLPLVSISTDRVKSRLVIACQPSGAGQVVRMKSGRINRKI